MTPDEIRDTLQVAALLGMAWRGGARLGEMSESLKHLTEAVNRITEYPERLAVVETTLQDHEGRLNRSGM